MEWLANLNIKWVLVAVGLMAALRSWLIRRPAPSPAAGTLREFIDSALVAAVLVFLIVRPFIAQAYFIPTHSMHPTLRQSDRILVNKAVYFLSEPKRLESVVFRPPAGAEEQIDYIKRIIALPGETVEIVPRRVMADGRTVMRLTHHAASEIARRNYGREPIGFTFDMDRGSARVDNHEVVVTGGLEGKVRIVAVDSGDRLEVRGNNVYRNGEQLVEVIFGPIDVSQSVIQWGGEADLDVQAFLVNGAPRLIAVRAKEITVDEAHILIDGRRLEEPYVANPPDYAMAPLKVPARHYFMMGDNRPESADSHIWGPLPRSHMIGRADFIFWPPDRFGPIRH